MKTKDTIGLEGASKTSLKELNPLILEIRALAPNLIAADILNVQPMDIDTAGEIFRTRMIRQAWWRRWIRAVIRATLCKIGLHPFQTQYLCYGLRGPAIACDCCLKELP